MLNNFKNRLDKLEKKDSCRTEMVEIEGMKITRLQLQQILKDISGKTTGLPASKFARKYY